MMIILKGFFSKYEFKNMTKIRLYCKGLEKKNITLKTKTHI